MFQRIPLFGASEVTPWGSTSQGDLIKQGVTVCLWKAQKATVAEKKQQEPLGEWFHHLLFSREENTYGS